MNRFFRSFVLSAVAAMGIVACSESDEPTLVPSNGTTLTASVSATTQTKVSFTDNGTDDTIDLAWENDDSFTLYNKSGNYVGDFTCNDADNASLVTVKSPLTMERVTQQSTLQQAQRPLMML
ncbi:MAG: hypothetical protein R3Y26_02165 [Rikenellaceae bacterium]